MSCSVFVDTNVFVYLFDSDEQQKQDTARNLLDCLAKEATIVVNTQVLQEFYVSVTRNWPNRFLHKTPWSTKK